eukprot:g26557.t1
MFPFAGLQNIDLRTTRRKGSQFSPHAEQNQFCGIAKIESDPSSAKLLQSPQAADIAVGPCVLLDRLGSGLRATTYLARPRDGRKPCVLKVIEIPSTALDAGVTRLEELTGRLQNVSHNRIVAPHTAAGHRGGLITISNHIGGDSFADLLVRRGRFAAAAITAIARQLVDALAAFEAVDGVHGDIRTANVRLTAHGDAVLVDAGLSPSIYPELIVDPRTPPERYDGIAPELIGTGAPADSRSDMYALGCLLWQLLAGRASYPSGDPLARLASHQTRRIVDIREWAPDTPAPLAEAIYSLTSPDPLERPSSFRALREAWGRPRRADRRRLAKLYAELHARVPVRRVATRASAGFRRSVVAASLFVGIAAALTFSDPRLRDQFAEATAPVAEYLADAAARFRSESDPRDDSGPKENDQETVAAGRGQKLPAPNADGLVELKTAGPYLWDSPVKSSRPIVIRGVVGVTPVIRVVPGRSRMTAAHVSFENVTFQIDNPASTDGSPSETAISVHSDSLTIRGCRLNSTPSPNADGEKRVTPAFIFYQSLNPSARTSGRVTLADTVCYGPADLFSFSETPRLIDCSHCLVAGGGRLLRASRLPAFGRDCRIRMKSVTLRGARSLLGAIVDVESTATGRFDLEATNCVFDFDQQLGALFHLAGDLDKVSRPLIRMSGVGSLARSDVRVAARAVNASRIEPLETPDRWVQFDGGILSPPFRFAGNDLNRPADSMVIVQGIPRRSSGAPGIDAARFTSGKPAEKLVTEMIAIPGKSGEEGRVVEFIRKKLKAAGIPDSAMSTDSANRKSPVGGETGNLIVKLPGTMKGPRRLLMAHIDTVPLCVGARPERKGKYIVSKDKHTALGGDDRAGASVVLNAAIEIMKQKLPHPPLTLFWPVQEEIGLYGARLVTKSKLGNPKLCFNWDGGDPTMAVIGATGDYSIQIEIEGIASHAGGEPEKGVSAIAIASRAIEDLTSNGWHGLIVKGKNTGTSNVGIINGGDATNVVTPSLKLKAEARSHDPKAPR